MAQRVWLDISNGRLLYARNEKALTKIRALEAAPGRQQLSKRRQGLNKKVITKADTVKKYGRDPDEKHLFSRDMVYALPRKQAHLMLRDLSCGGGRYCQRGQKNQNSSTALSMHDPKH